MWIDIGQLKCTYEIIVEDVIFLNAEYLVKFQTKQSVFFLNSIVVTVLENSLD